MNMKTTFGYILQVLLIAVFSCTYLYAQSSDTRGSMYRSAPTPVFRLAPLSDPQPGSIYGSFARPTPLQSVGAVDRRMPDHVRYFYRQNTPDHWRIGAISGIVLGTGVMVNHQMRNAWWSDARGPFHYQEAFDYARNLDKLGHVYAGYLASFVFYRMTNWTGINESRALWYGASLGLLFQLYIEVQDGFSNRWGFERWDAIGDLMGAALFVTRYYVKPLQYFQMKFSYMPSDRLGDRRDAAWVENWIDDYEGHTYWISFRAGQLAHDYLDAPPWVRLFNVAGGWSLGPMREHTEFYLGLDWNFEALPGSNWLLRRLWEGLDLIRFPAPAIRIRPDGVWYGLYF
jgi:hypothetical protein